MNGIELGSSNQEEESTRSKIAENRNNLSEKEKRKKKEDGQSVDLSADFQDRKNRDRIPA